MKSYTVVWTQDALNELAACWMDAPNPDAIRVSAEIVDEVLGRDPLAIGQHLSEGLYKATAAALRVLYTIHEEDRIVRVESVRPL